MPKWVPRHERYLAAVERVASGAGELSGDPSIATKGMGDIPTEVAKQLMHELEQAKASSGPEKVGWSLVARKAYSPE
eukprot:6459002-Pyramimonas_sp.AAC.1